LLWRTTSATHFLSSVVCSLGILIPQFQPV
jgi:hypothetical protein